MRSYQHSACFDVCGRCRTSSLRERCPPWGHGLSVLRCVFQILHGHKLRQEVAPDGTSTLTDAGVADFFRQIDDNLSGLPEVAAALEVTRALPVVLRGGVYFLNGLELVREECGCVFLDSDGRTHAQACCYLAIARASAGGAAAVKALGGLLERSARLGAVRAALTPFAATLKKLLVPTANIVARERGRHVDFQMSIPAEEEVHLSYALQVGTLTVVSDAGPLLGLQATRYRHPTRPSTLCQPEVFLFLDKKLHRDAASFCSGPDWCVGVRRLCAW